METDEKKEILAKLDEVRKIFQEWKEGEMKDVEEIWNALPYDIKLAATSYVFKRLHDHLKEGGTYRYLIYDRLGFDMDAYTLLYCSGGMDLSNACFEVRTKDKEEKEDTPVA